MNRATIEPPGQIECPGPFLFSSKTSAKIPPARPSLRRGRKKRSKAVDFLIHGSRILMNLAPLFLG